MPSITWHAQSLNPIASMDRCSLARGRTSTTIHLPGAEAESSSLESQYLLTSRFIHPLSPLAKWPTESGPNTVSVGPAKQGGDYTD